MKMLKVGIDIDGTITEHPELFSVLSKALMAGGHEVHIVTFRHEKWRDATEAELKEYGVEYTVMHMGRQIADLELKARWAKDFGLDIVFEDRIEVLENMPHGTGGILVLPKRQDV